MAKFKLELEDISFSLNTAFGLISNTGPLKLCFSLNEELNDFRLKRLSEDLYSDYKGQRFLFRVWHYYDSLREYEIKLVENRSYRSLGKAINENDLFGNQLTMEKNWLPNKNGYNFFLWFEANSENVKFTLRWQKDLQACSGIQKAILLENKDLDRLNNSIKYYHDNE